jgi:hypothetical protein
MCNGDRPIKAWRKKAGKVHHALLQVPPAYTVTHLRHAKHIFAATRRHSLLPQGADVPDAHRLVQGGGHHQIVLQVGRKGSQNCEFNSCLALPLPRWEGTATQAGEDNSSDLLHTPLPACAAPTLGWNWAHMT